MDKILAEAPLRYTLIMTQSPNQLETNLSAQQLAAAILNAGDIIDRVFFYQDACYTALASQIPGQGLNPSFEGWVKLHLQYNLDLQVCIANSLRRGLVDIEEGKRYQQTANLHSAFKLAGLGELAEACQASDRIITL